MFWGNLLGKDTPAGKVIAYLSDEFVEVKEFVNAIKAKQAQISEEKSQGKQASSTAMADAPGDADTAVAVQTTENVVTGGGTGDQAVENIAEAASEPAEPVADEPMANEPVADEAMADEPVTEQEPAALAVTAAEQQAVNNDDGQQNLAMDQSAASTGSNNAAFENAQQGAAFNNMQPIPANAFAAPSYSRHEGSFVPAEVERQLSNVDEHGEVIDPSNPVGAVRDMWITARKSFYERNYELSEKSYRQVIDSTKNNFDAYGELGNVYFNQGKDKEAAAAYFEAAAILIKKGQVSRARSLMGLMRHLDKSKAIELQQLIDAAQS
jgi:tetratricopeptide (TPR) repeat protein